MSPGAHTERAFEDRVEEELLSHGWVRGEGDCTAPSWGLTLVSCVGFIGATQTKSWERLHRALRRGPGRRRSGSSRSGSRLRSTRAGCLTCCGRGCKDRGVQIDLAYFRPGHTLAADALDEYNANVLTVARQLHFSVRDPHLSVDMALFVNGLPVATVELKNPNTGQNADHAIAQYRRRDPNDLFFAKRALVHFAVDPDRAFITTRLRGRDTQFLPFNVGSNGAGKSGGAGNPPARPGYDYSVSYLWEQIWQRDNWLEILQRFMHVQATDKKAAKENPHTSPRIFPRYHQWDAVQKMVAHAREHGAGHNYLVEHSAGSGKSNTIAWLAHRLSSLFDDWQPAGVPQGHRDHRPGCARPAAAADDLPVRPHARRRQEDRRGLGSAGRRRWTTPRRRSSSARCRCTRTCWTRSPTRDWAAGGTR